MKLYLKEVRTMLTSNPPIPVEEYKELELEEVKKLSKEENTNNIYKIVDVTYPHEPDKEYTYYIKATQEDIERYKFNKHAEHVAEVSMSTGISFEEYTEMADDLCYYPAISSAVERMIMKGWTVNED